MRNGKRGRTDEVGLDTVKSWLGYELSCHHFMTLKGLIGTIVSQGTAKPSDHICLFEGVPFASVLRASDGTHRCRLVGCATMHIRGFDGSGELDLRRSSPHAKESG